MFSSSGTSPLSDFFPNIQQKITPEIKNMLIRPIADSEVHDAMVLIGSDRAPGPDGFTAFFYQQF